MSMPLFVIFSLFSSLLSFMLAYSDYCHCFYLFVISFLYYRLYDNTRVAETVFLSPQSDRVDRLFRNFSNNIVLCIPVNLKFS